MQKDTRRSSGGGVGGEGEELNEEKGRLGQCEKAGRLAGAQTVYSGSMQYSRAEYSKEERIRGIRQYWKKIRLVQVCPGGDEIGVKECTLLMSMSDVLVGKGTAGL